VAESILEVVDPSGAPVDVADVQLPPARTTAEAIAKAIRGEILAGRYDGGEKLRQVEVAKRYQVSTTPVREAFGILQRQGLVRIHPQRGATAVVPNIRDLEELYEIRVAIECLAVEHAATNFRPADAPPLRALLAEMRECRDSDRYVELNHKFHMGVYKLSGRERLIEMIEQLRMASQAYLQITSDQMVPAGQAENEHDDILAACEANDPERARIATRDHLMLTVTNAVAQLDRTDKSPGREGLKTLREHSPERSIQTHPA
jgi:DNA-binding GntR family transcriptional regulator